MFNEIVEFTGLPIADDGKVPLDTTKIKDLREKLHLTMEQAAIRAGFKGKSLRQQWNRFENADKGGGRSNPTLSTLEAIARALGVTAKDLLK